MEQNKNSSSLAMRIALAAVLTAVTAVFTLIVRVPIAPTRGYINLGDAAIYFTAFTFGPITAMIAAGLGTAIADLIGGYPQWAPITFVINALRGLAVGLVIRSAAWKVPDEQTSKLFPLSVVKIIVSGLVGIIIMVSLYFLAGGIMYGFPAAVVEVPGNIIQNLVGILLGALLAVSVFRAYPPVRWISW